MMYKNLIILNYELNCKLKKMKMKKKILLVGFGNMGQMLYKFMSEKPDLEVKVVDPNEEFRHIAYLDINTALESYQPDVVIDFTTPSVAFENANIYLDNKIPSVIGTTGFKPEQIEVLEQRAKDMTVGMFIAPNFSVGSLGILRNCIANAKLFKTADIRIAEHHHKGKKDSPSGTAVEFARQMLLARDVDISKIELIEISKDLHSFGSIRIDSYREGHIKAKQIVTFSMQGHVVEIMHDAPDRENYLDGINAAIEFVLVNQKFRYGLGSII